MKFGSRILYALLIRTRLDGMWIDPLWGGEIFRIRPARRWGVPSTGSLSLGVKRPERGVDHPLPLNT